ncbi:MAG: choice-of-anchor J domain-containing protein [Bacteroidales bacterium]|nr:choice-of-anchor J domain-containing protein [Bacteroidales bacterium]
MATKTLRVLALSALLATPFVLAAQQSLPYSYGFEEAAEMNRWTTQSMNTENAAAMQRTAAQHNSGSYGFLFSSQTSAANSNYNQYLISPELDCQGGMHLTLYYRKHSSWMNESFRVGYSSTDSQVSSFTWLGFTTTSGSGTPWTAYDVNLPAGTRYVAINYNGYNGGSSKGLYIDDISMASAASCMPVTNLEVSAATQSSLTLSWTDANNSGATYAVFDMSDTSVVAQSVNGTTYTVTGLQPNRVYTYGVVADCGSGDYSTRVSVSGRTECGVVTDDNLPWVENFDAYTSGTLGNVPCYSILNYGYGSNTTYPYVSTTQGIDGANSKALAFLCRGTSQYELAILPEFSSFDGKSIVFNVKDAGSYNYNTTSTEYGGVLEVGVISDPANQSTFSALATFSNMDYTWRELTVDLSAYTGTGRHIAFRCHNTVANSNGTLYVDNIVVLESPTCSRLAGVSVDGITSDEAVVHIADTSEEGGTYIVTLTSEDDTLVFDGIGDTVYTLSGLSSNTLYTVSASEYCSDGTLTAPVTAALLTACSEVAADEMPWSENFDALAANTVGMVPCWTILNATSDYPKVFSSYNHGTTSGNSLYWVGATSGNTVCVLPEFEVPMNQLIVNLWFYTTAASGGVQIGYVTDKNNAASFVPLQNYAGPNYLATPWNNVELTVSGVPETATNLAIRYVGQSDRIAIDEVVVRKAPECPRPTAVVVSDITDGTAQLHIANTDQNPDYTVLIYSGTDTVVNNQSYSTGDFTVSGLDANKVYTVEVVANCNVGGSHSPVTVQFRTQCAAIAQNSLPWSEGFDTYPGNAGGLDGQYTMNIPCWTTACRYSGYFPYYFSGAHRDGANSLYCYGEPSQPTVFALPWFATDLSDLQLSFALRKAESQGGIEVGVMSNPMDTNTFVLVQNCTPTTANTWQVFDITFAGFSTGNIAFRSTSQAMIDSLVVNTITSCTRPVITLGAVTSTSATVNLSDANNANQYILYVNGSTTGINVYGNSYELDGLTPGTIYSLTARTACTGGSLSQPCPEVTFSTQCNAIDVLPWSEDFETWATGDSNYNPCWRTVTDALSIYPYADFDNNNKTMFYYASSGVYDACFSMAKLPEFEAAVNTLAMTFRYRVSLNPTDCRIVVGVAGNGNDTTGFTRIATFTPENANWHEYDVNFSGYNGTNSRIAVMLTVGSTDRASFGYLDDIEVYTAGNCARPQTIAIRNISSDSAVVSWTATPAAGDYIVKWSDDDSVTVNDVTSYTINGLDPYTEYTVSVRRDCGDEQSRPRTAVFRTHALAAELPYATGFESADDTLWNYAQADNNRWYIGNSVHRTGARSLYISNNGGVGNDYNSDNTRSYAFRILDFSNSGDYDISFDWKANGEEPVVDCDYLKVYLAPEADAPVADLTDIPSSWQSLTSPLSNVTEWQSLYTVASLEEAGTYALVFCWKVDGLTTRNPAAAIDNVMVAVQTCAPPADLVYGTATSTSISFSWSAGGTETAWDVNIDNTGWQRVNVTYYTATGLTPDTDHDIAVRAVCGEGGNSFALTGTMHTGTLGIADAMEASVAVTPNPATSTVTVSAEAMREAAIIDLNGRTVTTKPMTNGSATFDVSAIARGAYFVRLTGEQVTAVRKLIVR